MVAGTAYAVCLRVARQHYENFPVASRLLPRALRPHVAAVYSFARTADDFADEGDLTDARRLALLDEWQARLHQAAAGQVVQDGSDAAAIFTALAESGELVPRLQRMSSTTFDAQLKVASLVAHDNPHLYFEIQRLNDYGYTSIEALRAAVEKIQGLIARGDEAGFVRLMESGRHYLEKR